MMNFIFDRINTVAIAALSLSLGAYLIPTESVQADTPKSVVTVINTFEDTRITGGVQTFYGMGGPEPITDNIEFPNFIGFYDTDVSDTSLSITLVDNSGATDPIIPANRFDRHYIKFDNSIITSASLDGSEGLNAFARVEMLEPGFSLDATDVFGTGMTGPIEFENGGLLIEIGPGSDFRNLGISATVNFTLEPVPEL